MDYRILLIALHYNPYGWVGSGLDLVCLLVIDICGVKSTPVANEMTRVGKAV